MVSFLPRENAPAIRRAGDWIGYRADLGTLTRGTSLVLAWNIWLSSATGEKMLKN
jgi:hypothetical protein